MDNKLYFKNNLDKSNLNYIVELAAELSKLDYEVNSIEHEEYNIILELFKDDYDISIGYENGGNIYICGNDTDNTINLFQKLSKYIF